MLKNKIRKGLKRKTFLRAREFGFKYACKSFLMNVSPAQLDGLGLGIIASKRSFRLATQRNRAIRVLREALRTSLKENTHNNAPNSFDVILVARRGVGNINLDELKLHINRSMHLAQRFIATATKSTKGTTKPVKAAKTPNN